MGLNLPTGLLGLNLSAGDLRVPAESLALGVHRRLRTQLGLWRLLIVILSGFGPCVVP
jgi:hypothetical protein